MTDEEKPDPIEDVRKGLGLLFRAARGAIQKLPTRDLEEATTTGVREVARALENVGRTIEREVFGGKAHPTSPTPAAPPAASATPDAAKPESPGAAKPEEPKPEEPRPRV
jgi:hypothetical protein